jgi:glycerate 2-kinase
VIAAGKAAASMALAARDVLDVHVVAGLVIAPSAVEIGDPFRVIRGEHPQPWEGSEQGGRAALALARDAARAEHLLVLLSGGASSLMAAPAQGITLADKRQATAVLLRAGADITALNTVRKHLSAVKGGWLAASSKARCFTLVLSDVVGDDPAVIASGPTIGDASTFQDACEVLSRFGGIDAYPPAVVRRLSDGTRGREEETPKPEDPRLAHSVVRIIGGRHDAMGGVAAAARQRGYQVLTLDRAVTGEARDAAPAYLGDVLARARSLPRPICIVSSGETTVAVKGQGRGGRNQEFALAAADLLQHEGPGVLLASVGTDGVDGPTDAAGALADATTASRAAALGLQPMRAYLDNNDAHGFFGPLGDLIHTGPTGTNVGDLQVILLA